MATKSIDKKKTLEYAVAFYFYDSGCVNFMMGKSCTSISKPFMTKGQTAEGKTH